MTRITNFIKWGLRIALFISVTYMLLNYGMDMIYSLMCATIFMIFWFWLMWTEDKINPIIEWDENNG